MSAELLLTEEGGAARPLWLLTEAALAPWLAQQPASVVNWVHANNFQAERQRVLVLPGEAGQVGGAVLGLGPLRGIDDLNLWHAAGLSDRLPGEHYRLASPLNPPAATQFALGWLIGSYRMTRYRSAGTGAARGADRPARDRHPPTCGPPRRRRRWRAI